MIKVMVVDDHLLVRKGVKSILERSGTVEIVGEAADGLEALRKASELNPDIMIIDMMMPGLNGIQIIEKMKSLQPKTSIIVLSMYAEVAMVRKAFRSGARGYLVKQSITEELTVAVKRVAEGYCYLSPTLMEH
jgi:DNA-binding NarL/FixJ family response regulator